MQDRTNVKIFRLILHTVIIIIASSGASFVKEDPHWRERFLTEGLVPATSLAFLGSVLCDVFQRLALLIYCIALYISSFASWSILLLFRSG